MGSETRNGFDGNLMLATSRPQARLVRKVVRRAFVLPYSERWSHERLGADSDGEGVSLICQQLFDTLCTQSRSDR